MLDISSVVKYKDKMEILTDEIKNEILGTVAELNNKGMKVITIAQKNHPSEVGIFSVTYESDMVLMIYLAFSDPS